jgi:catechol 2,3-dioxygenase-like lactoylglutathione lyase family enzyme
MKMKRLMLAAVFGGMLASWGQTQNLPTPGFHHLHLNSTNPDAAIDFYTKQFPSTMKASLAGFPALKAGNVYVLFTRVNTPAPTEPQTAIWHFGWHVTDVRENLKMYQQRKEVKLLPLYASEKGDAVFVSSDALPGTGGVLGLTKADRRSQGESGETCRGRGLGIPTGPGWSHHRISGEHAG